MAYRTLEINVRSAKHLNNVNFISKMDAYVVVSIAGDSTSANQKTPIDREGNTNPNWNFSMNFILDESSVSRNLLSLLFKLRCERALGDKDIGEVTVPISDLIGPAGEDKPQFVTYQVTMPSGKPKGELNFSYKWGDKVSAPIPQPAPEKMEDPVTVYQSPPVEKLEDPVTAYPSVPGPNNIAYPPPPGPYNLPDPLLAHPGTSAAAYHHPQPAPDVPYAVPPVGYPYQSQPPPAGYGYDSYPPPPPPTAGYGYPPPPPTAGYGYPPPPQHPAGYGYPPPPHPAGYGYPPPPPPPSAGYGYPPPPQAGYGYPPGQQAHQSSNSGLGLGLGAGLVGGAVGGLLIGDMIDDGFDCGF